MISRSFRNDTRLTARGRVLAWARGSFLVARMDSRLPGVDVKVRREMEKPGALGGYEYAVSE